MATAWLAGATKLLHSDIYSKQIIEATALSAHLSVIFTGNCHSSNAIRRWLLFLVPLQMALFIWTKIPSKYLSNMFPLLLITVMVDMIIVICYWWHMTTDQEMHWPYKLYKFKSYLFINLQFRLYSSFMTCIPLQITSRILHALRWYLGYLSSTGSSNIWRPTFHTVTIHRRLGLYQR